MRTFVQHMDYLTELESEKYNLINKEKFDMDNFCKDICDKLSLRSTDYLGYVGFGDGRAFFPNVLNSTRGCVVCEYMSKEKYALQKKEEMTNVRFVSSVEEFDRSVFDKILVMCNDNVINNQNWSRMIKSILQSCDNNAKVLLVGIDDTLLSPLMASFLDSIGCMKSWVFENSQENKSDLLFEFKKYD